MLQLREYQSEALDAIFDYWQSGGGSPLVDLATGLGKSVVIAELTRRLVETYPDLRVLMLVHIRELVEQNYKALVRLWPEAPAGIYSAGLNKRDAHHRITFASIQSVYKKAAILGPRDVVIVDECHLFPANGEGMYQTLLDHLRIDRPDLRLVGFTATPFRMDSGRLDKGGIFDKTVYSFGIGRGIRDGWLAPLKSKASATEIDVSGVGKRGGEFIASALEEAALNSTITHSAAAEMLRYGADRKSWLVFCTGVKHAYRVRDVLREIGISADTVTGETPSEERRSIIEAFKVGRIRALTNANVLTTGFDAPGVDMVAFLRPTLSTGLYVQMVGRGTRKAEGKEDCLILDFSGNVRRHGPVDIATIDRGPVREGGEDEEETGKVKEDDENGKPCPSCETYVAKTATECPHCFFQFPIKEKPKHAPVAEAIPILSTEPTKPVGRHVYKWTPRRHEKPGAPDSVRVLYHSGLQMLPDWICPEHGGYARRKFEAWWLQHGGSSPPRTVQETIDRWPELTMPQTIFTRPNGRWEEITGRSFFKAAAE
jgi:DNA repair protein RadD